MLAKPGAFARAQHSLASVPHPFRSTKRRSARVVRYAQITRLAARHGLGRSLGIADEEDSMTERPTLPVRVRRALEDAGGMFVKLGQVLSTRSDLVPEDFVRELTRLQDQAAPAPRVAVEQLLVEELGQPPAELFDAFDWEPIAAASIGQAYRARLRSGEDVIVKVQRPGVAQAVERDLDVLAQLGHALESRAGWALEYRVSDLIGEFADRLREELDFRIEARNASEIAAHLTEMPAIRVPKVFEELSTARVLVMEWLDGVGVRQGDRLDEMGCDRSRLAELLLRCSLRQMLVDGHYHADPHPGNILVLSPGVLGLIDFGAAGRLDTLQQSSLRQMMLAITTREPGLLRQAVLEVAAVRAGFDDDLFERSLARFMTIHLGPGSRPSAAMFNDLLRLLFSAGVVLPAKFSTFFRALVTLEGTLTILSPGYLIIDAASHIVGEWALERLEPATAQELARNELVRLLPVIRRLPRQLDRLGTIAQRGDLRLRLSLFSSAEDARLLTKLVNRVVLSFLGGIVGVVSVMLIGIRGGPAFTGRTTLYEFFGYFGLFCSSILVMRVLVAVFRDGPG